jgi:hypothetical protein
VRLLVRIGDDPAIGEFDVDVEPVGEHGRNRFLSPWSGSADVSQERFARQIVDDDAIVGGSFERPAAVKTFQGPCRVLHTA